MTINCLTLCKLSPDNRQPTTGKGAWKLGGGVTTSARQEPLSTSHSTVRKLPEGWQLAYGVCMHLIPEICTIHHKIIAFTSNANMFSTQTNFKNFKHLIFFWICFFLRRNQNIPKQYFLSGIMSNVFFYLGVFFECVASFYCPVSLILFKTHANNWIWLNIFQDSKPLGTFQKIEITANFIKFQQPPRPCKQTPFVTCVNPKPPPECRSNLEVWKRGKMWHVTGLSTPLLAQRRRDRCIHWGTLNAEGSVMGQMKEKLSVHIIETNVCCGPLESTGGKIRQPQPTAFRHNPEGRGSSLWGRKKSNKGWRRPAGCPDLYIGGGGVPSVLRKALAAVRRDQRAYSGTLCQATKCNLWTMFFHIFLWPPMIYVSPWQRKSPKRLTLNDWKAHQSLSVNRND